MGRFGAIFRKAWDLVCHVGTATWLYGLPVSAAMTALSVYFASALPFFNDYAPLSYFLLALLVAFLCAAFFLCVALIKSAVADRKPFISEATIRSVIREEITGAQEAVKPTWEQKMADNRRAAISAAASDYLCAQAIGRWKRLTLRRLAAAKNLLDTYAGPINGIFLHNPYKHALRQIEGNLLALGLSQETLTERVQSQRDQEASHPIYASLAHDEQRRRFEDAQLRAYTLVLDEVSAVEVSVEQIVRAATWKP